VTRVPLVTPLQPLPVAREHNLRHVPPKHPWAAAQGVEAEHALPSRQLPARAQVDASELSNRHALPALQPVLLRGLHDAAFWPQQLLGHLKSMTREQPSMAGRPTVERGT